MKLVRGSGIIGRTKRRQEKKKGGRKDGRACKYKLHEKMKFSVADSSSLKSGRGSAWRQMSESTGLKASWSWCVSLCPQ